MRCSAKLLRSGAPLVRDRSRRRSLERSRLKAGTSVARCEINVRVTTLANSSAALECGESIEQAGLPHGPGAAILPIGIVWAVSETVLRPIGLKADRRPMRVLVIEDHQRLARLIVEGLA